MRSVRISQRSGTDGVVTEEEAGRAQKESPFRVPMDREHGSRAHGVGGEELSKSSMDSVGGKDATKWKGKEQETECSVRTDPTVIGISTLSPIRKRSPNGVHSIFWTQNFIDILNQNLMSIDIHCF